jgi:hypothetical protein
MILGIELSMTGKGEEREMTIPKFVGFISCVNGSALLLK